MKLIMCLGLPGSGKTTWAKAFINEIDRGAELWVRVNKDDIRAELTSHGWVWSKKNEQKVIQVRDANIRSALSMGVSVISDDTNLAPKHQIRLKELARLYGATFEVKDFRDMPIEVCVERDAARAKPVGERVIKDMARQYGVGGVEADFKHRVITDENLPEAIIVDVDGTLALHEGVRGPYDTAKALDDHLNEPVANILRVYDRENVNIIIVSGREAQFKDLTCNWLVKHNLPFDAIYTRVDGDKRNDAIVKREIFFENINGKFNVLFVLDDRDRVVKMWRKDLGLTCLQVAYGDF